MISEFLDLLIRVAVRGEITASVSIVLVLALRLPARRLIGPSLAYSLWGMPLAAVIASLFPTLSDFMHGASPLQTERLGVLSAMQEQALLKAWLGGAGVFAAALLLSELRFRRLVARGAAGPAVMGVAWHRLVIPRDFRTRFTPVEQSFVLRHERMHIARRDPLANLLMGVLQAVSWFNPLVHWAAACARLDQELACDAAVISNRPESRRAYAETLLKAQLCNPQSPFACAFAGHFLAGARHPLEVRLAMLGRPQPGLVRDLAGACAVAAISLSIAAAVWVGAPERPRGASLAWEDPSTAIAAAPAPSG